ncbi:MAG: DNA translocase FtsK [Verrucomicrobia bacterium]|nr:DNA translocase FtsK [Verrucomicrobiota bacterium]
MAKQDTSNLNNGPSFQSPTYRPNWWAAVICLLLGIYLTAALVDYVPAQSPWHGTGARAVNIVGWVGADLVAIGLIILGGSVYLIPVFLFWVCYLAFRKARRLAGARFAAMVIAIVALAVGLAMFQPAKWASDYFPQGPGGFIGLKIYHGALADALGELGTALLLATVYFSALVFVFTKDFTAEIEKYIASFNAWRDERAKQKAAFAEARQKAKAEAARTKAAAVVAPPVKAEAPAPAPAVAAPPPAALAAKKFSLPKADDPLAKPARPEVAEPVVPAAPPEAKFAPPPPPPKPAVPPPPALKLPPKPPAPPATDVADLEAVASGKIPLNIVKPEEPKKAAPVDITPRSDDQNYQFPQLSILKEQVKPSAANSEEEHRNNAENLLRILREFGVEVTLGEIHVGPVITRYELVPAPGVRVEKIAGLDKNIALGMRAQSVRILAPIPGKAAVGVEVPNQHPTPVGMREVLESEEWRSAKNELPIALGKDVSGKPLISDLTKMPHLLIAGATGSGKSVCINSIVASILYSASPKDVRLIMVDPKVVELKIFNSLPHMLIPVVTEPKKVPGALKWLLGEMEQRYQIFAKCNVRNIVGFNGRKKDGAPETPAADAQPTLEGIAPPVDEIEIPERLPYIVAIIDELADLMMVAPAEIETSIARLAQLARAAGIHLIIATQRPSVNVITGVIKANLPSRIAFQVASQVDSRTILDTKGADTLIGRGDMLFSPPGSSRLVRAQGAFVSDDEVIALVESLKKNGPPQYAQTVQQQIDRAAREDDDEDEDGGDDEDLGDDTELYEQALDVLKSTKRASTSMIQRRLRIGYNRAARIMDLMEEKGVVGPENGSSPREILVDLDSL